MTVRPIIGSLVLMAVLVSMTANFAKADIVGSGGAVVVDKDIPANIENQQWTSETEIRAWFERDTALTTDLTLNHVRTGLVDSNALLVPGTAVAGTVIQSYMARFDPRGTDDDGIYLQGFVIFNTPILGVIITRKALLDTDNEPDALIPLGRPGVIYNTNNLRGMELETNEFFEISQDRLRVDFKMHVTHLPTDDIRIVTEPCPCRCPADFNHDGFVTGDDIDAYVDAFTAGDSSTDFNHDGFVTGDDFDAYVDAFEAGC